MRTFENSMKQENSAASSLLGRMQFFYELFPYPDRPLFFRPNPNGSIEAHAGFAKIIANQGEPLEKHELEDLKLRDVVHAFPRNKRLALVGCGTDEPLLFRTLHPHNPIVGIDLSLKSLRRAQRKLGWHRQKPVDFIHGDAVHALRSEGLFAHIQCFGVLHHQPKPQTLIKAMAQSLEQGGTLRLMIYPSKGRQLERGIQKKFAGLWDAVNDSSAEGPLQAGKPTTPRRKILWESFKLLIWRVFLPLLPNKNLAQRFGYIGFSRARIADAFLHPSDHHMPLDNVLGWAQSEGLELVYCKAKSYDHGWMTCHSAAAAAAGIKTLVSEDQHGNIASNLVLIFKKVAAGAWTST